MPSRGRRAGGEEAIPSPERGGRLEPVLPVLSSVEGSLTKGWGTPPNLTYPPFLARPVLSSVEGSLSKCPIEGCSPNP